MNTQHETNLTGMTCRLVSWLLGVLGGWIQFLNRPTASLAARPVLVRRSDDTTGYATEKRRLLGHPRQH